MGADNVRVLAELHPEPTLLCKPAQPEATSQQLAPKCLERNHLRARTIHLVVDHVNQAHSPLVDVEDLESPADPVSQLKCAHHGGCLPSVGPHSLREETAAGQSAALGCSDSN